MNLLAIDPGTTESALLEYDVGARMPIWWEKMPNKDALGYIKSSTCWSLHIEMIASYGMAVGAEVFDTCVWIGRFCEAWEASGRSFPPRRVYRKDVKLHLCHSNRAKDANIRQALMDRYGGKKAIGTKAKPGPLHGMSGDCWAALAVAVTVADVL